MAFDTRQMMRDDGYTLPYNAAVYDTDQKTKKRWVLLAALPADYVARQNEIKARRQAAESARAAYLAKTEQDTADKLAALQASTKAQLVVQPQAAVAAQAMADQHFAPMPIVISEASGQELAAWMKLHKNVTLDPEKELQSLRQEVAKILGIPTTETE